MNKVSVHCTFYISYLVKKSKSFTCYSICFVLNKYWSKLFIKYKEL